MPTPYNDRWERTKRYLLRNFLVDPGFRLSPIPEGERSSPDSDSSSLPDLIVEPEPNRHDHSPAFYVRLEQRMRRLHQQLFMGTNYSDNEDISDFEVNQIMTSTSILNNDARKDNETNSILLDKNIGSDIDISITKEKQWERSTIVDDEDDIRVNEDTNGNKLIDTCATYNETSRLSIDNSNKSSSAENEDEGNVESIESRSKSIETETNLSSNEGNDNTQNEIIKRQNLTDFNERSRCIRSIDLESEVIRNKSLSEDSIEQCHRVSTAIAQIHESSVRGSVQFDNGSPVLISRMLRFGRRVFVTQDDRTFSGQSINILKSSDENINLPTHTAEDLNKQDIAIEEPETDVQRLLSASEFTKIGIETIDSQLLVNVVATQKDQEDVTRRHEVNAEDNIQVSDKEDPINLEVDRQARTTEILGIKNTSLDWNKDAIDEDENWFDYAIRKGEFAGKARKFISQSSEESFDENLEPIAHSTISEDVEPFEVMRDARVSGANVSWNGNAEQASPMLSFQPERSAERPEDVSSDSNEIDASLTGTEIGEEEEIEKDIEEAEEIEEGEESENEIEEEESVESENEIEEEEAEESENKTEEEEAEDSENEIEEPEEIEEEEAEESENKTEEEEAEDSENEIEEPEEIEEEERENEIEEPEEIEEEERENDIKEPEEIEEERENEIEENTEEHLASNPRARIIDEFWSVSPIPVDTDNLAKNTSTNKRRSESNDDAPTSKRKKDVATQTTDNSEWQNVRNDFLVGTPLVYKLCRCKDHVCS